MAVPFLDMAQQEECDVWSDILVASGGIPFVVPASPSPSRIRCAKEEKAEADWTTNCERI